MSRVDFYLLESSDHASRLHMVCRLTEKAYRMKNRVFVQTELPEQQARIDNLLWTFRAGSFIPHRIVNTPIADIAEPVAIGNASDPAEGFDLAINLDGEPASGQFDRIIEIIDLNESIRRSGRHRYREYQNRGDTLSTHKILV